MGHPDPGASEAKASDVTLTVGSDGSIFLGESPIAADDLGPQLVALRKSDPQRRVLLKGHMYRPYGEMRELFKQVQSAGFTGVKLMVGEGAAQHGQGVPPRGGE
jgi:biopolymer transport protein TolR